LSPNQTRVRHDLASRLDSGFRQPGRGRGQSGPARRACAGPPRTSRPVCARTGTAAMRRTSRSARMMLISTPRRPLALPSRDSRPRCPSRAAQRGCVSGILAVSRMR
jgi:hypothetical protein